MSVAEIKSFEEFVKVMPVESGMSIKAAAYSAYVTSLREAGVVVVVSDKVTPPVPKRVAAPVHEAASRPGYCYLYMFGTQAIHKAMYKLSNYPRLENVLSLASGCYRHSVMKHLRLSKDAEGRYHIGADGTWSLMGALRDYCERGGSPGNLPASLFKVPIEYAELKSYSVIGSSIGTEDSISCKTFTFENDVPDGFGSSIFVVGQRMKLMVEGDDQFYIVVYTGEKTFHSVPSGASDSILPVVSVVYHNDKGIVTVERAVCEVCGNFGDVLEHKRICNKELVVTNVDVDRDTNYSVFTRDVAVAFSKLSDEKDMYDVADGLAADYYDMWLALGMPVNISSGSDLCTAGFSQRFLSMYDGSFRAGFIRMLNYYVVLGNSARSLVHTYELVSTMVPSECVDEEFDVVLQRFVEDVYKHFCIPVRDGGSIVDAYAAGLYPLACGQTCRLLFCTYLAQEYKCY